jgi:Prenyltransferase, beta subunit
MTTMNTMNTSDSNQPRPGIPALFTQPPPIRDPLITETVDLQNATLEKCLPFLKGIHSAQKDFNVYGVPALQRDIHAGFLYDALEDYPSGFVAMDASRPWIVYWALAGLAMLGEETTRFRERCVHMFPSLFLFLFCISPLIFTFPFPFPVPASFSPQSCFFLFLSYIHRMERASGDIP